MFSCVSCQETHLILSSECVSLEVTKLQEGEERKAVLSRGINSFSLLLFHIKEEEPMWVCDSWFTCDDSVFHATDSLPFFRVQCLFITQNEKQLRDLFLEESRGWRRGIYTSNWESSPALLDGCRIGHLIASSLVLGWEREIHSSLYYVWYKLTSEKGKR